MIDSWVAVADDSEFPIENLPYGSFRSGDSRRVGTAIGDKILDLVSLEAAGLLELPTGTFEEGTLNRLLQLGQTSWSRLRRRITELLIDREAQPLVMPALLPGAEVSMELPFVIGDYVDFYSSRNHAENLGRLLRPGQDPLPPSWLHLPIGYHGRAGTVVVSGTPVRRPWGQVMGPSGSPEWTPARMLDFEVELGFVTGAANQLGSPIPIAQAEDHIFGVVLVNDWSARDIQRFEYVPLGPFLAKSFATSISPWVVPMQALASHRVPRPTQDPPVLDYLREDSPTVFDIQLVVELGGGPITATNSRHLYWSMAQQLTHAASNGALVRAGDLFASGTISGPDSGSYGSLMELSAGGTQPVQLSDGSRRSFLEDGDTVVIRGWAGGEGRPRIGLGSVTGTVLPAQPVTT